MRKIFSIVMCLAVLSGFNHLTAQNCYYWCHGSKQPLEIVEKQQYILVKSASAANILSSKMTSAHIKSDFKELSLSSSLKGQETGQYWSKITLPDPIKKYDDPAILYSSPFFFTENGVLVGISHLFYVKLKNAGDFVQLEKTAKENNIKILGNNHFMPLWYTLACSKESAGNALEMANVVYETGLFSEAIPDIMTDDFLNCVNDSFFTDQWGLNNTGQNDGIVGVDINYCNARQITTGNADIVVAVLDHGVESNHPDLTNMYSLSFDTENGTSPSIVRGNHGTACAGIIGANANNNNGVAGIAPNCPIMSISNSLAGTPDSRMKRADGINFAWNNGASVISNSWRSSVQYAVIDDAINNAAMYGRNDKGCVIVFASGNDYNSTVSYPARLDNVIAVGSINSSGIRADFSNYGTALDLVAPGVNISTTDRQGNNGYNTYSSTNDYTNRDYTKNFSGTSAACPLVAGIAALVLSVNPNLTGRQVRDIIESTAQKVGGYNYQPDQNHPNGTWNNEVGYGLVDAYAAVQKAMNYHNDLYVRDTVTDDGTMPSNEYSTWDSPDIWMEDTLGHYVAHPHGNAKYVVCVRIHNRRDVASSGTERLFLNWAKAGFNDKWDEYWTSNNLLPCGAPKGGVIGSANGKIIPSIPANGYRIDTIHWITPAGEDYANCTDFNYDQWHFCLLARIHDDDVIAHENEHNADVHQLVKNHNNVAQQNVYFYSAENYRKTLSIGNVHTIDMSRIICLSPKVIGNISITDYAEVYITLDAGLLAAIDNTNISGLTWVSDNTLRWNGGSACIPVTLPANSYYTMMTTVHFLANQIPANNTFEFDIVLRNANGDSILGGEHYKCVRTEGRYFQTCIYRSESVLWGEPVTLTACDIEEDAEYIWYDDQGEEVGYGLTCYVAPLQPTTYTLRVTADEDGYRSYCQLTINVTDGKLRMLAPNPADNQVRIGYALSRNVSSATLQILNGNGQVVHSQVLNGGNGSKVTGEVLCNTSSLAAGSYSVRLVSSKGKVYDSKTLIIN